jgi:glycosyltransferase involved in cell wall biosynthesis
MGQTIQSRFMLILPTWLPTYENKNIGKLISYLSGIDISVIVLCGKTDYENHFNSLYPNCTLVSSRRTTRWFDIFGAIKQLILDCALILRYKPEVIWTYSGYRENLFLSILKDILNFKLIIKNDSRLLDKKVKNLKKIRQWIFDIFPVVHSDGVISETTEVYENYESICGPLKNHRIYSNGADLSGLKIALSSLGSEAGNKEKYILMTGRLNGEKGVDLAVKAFSKLAINHPEWKFLLVGDQGQDEETASAHLIVQDCNLQERVIWVPFCSGLNLLRYYYLSSIFINTSRNEGLPNRFIEAMFFKCAILTFDVGQCKYLVDDDRGVLVEDNKLETFADELSKLMLNQNLRDLLGIRASRFIEENFDDKINLPSLVGWMRR